MHISARLKAAFAKGVRNRTFAFLCGLIKYLSRHRNGLCVMMGLLFYAISSYISILVAHWFWVVKDLSHFLANWDYISGSLLILCTLTIAADHVLCYCARHSVSPGTRVGYDPASGEQEDSRRKARRRNFTGWISFNAQSNSQLCKGWVFISSFYK